jgi:hypothetical protein
VKTIKGGTLEVHWIEKDAEGHPTHNGTVTSKEAEVTVNIGGISCTYGSQTGTDIGTLTGGSPAKIDINAVVNKVAGGFACPSTAIWEANYTVTEPKSLYVLKE